MKNRSVSKKPRRYIRDFNYHGCVNQLPRNDDRIPKFLKQRKERGFDDSETWGLAGSIASYVLPRLKRFREIRGGHPGSLTDEKWDEILGDMIVAFELLELDFDGWSIDLKDWHKVNKGLKLFAKWFGALWW